MLRRRGRLKRGPQRCENCPSGLRTVYLQKSKRKCAGLLWYSYYWLLISQALPCRLAPPPLPWSVPQTTPQAASMPIFAHHLISSSQQRSIQASLRERRHRQKRSTLAPYLAVVVTKPCEGLIEGVKVVSNGAKGQP